MSAEELTGADTPQDVAGIRVVAPGVTGVAESLGADVTPALRTPSAQLLHRALANSGLNATAHIALSHATAATGDVTVTVAAPKDGYNSVLMIHDSTGALSWHLPDHIRPRSSEKVPASTYAAAVGEHATASDAAPPSVSFTVAARRFAASAEHVSRWAHLIGVVEHFFFHPSVDGARKLLSVVEYPVEHLVGTLGSTWFAAWENNKHPYVVRWFPPEGNLSAGEPLSPTNWHELAEGPTLLFIHGIFSDCASGFSGLGKDDTTWAELRERYQGRIIGFDHPTASVTPAENAAWFLDQLPNVKLDVDIVCHSRGGLVARSLTAQSAAWGGDGQALRVHRIVFAATPNGGSPITEVGEWESLINRISSLLTLPAKFLPAPADAIAAILAALLEIVKIVAVGVTLDLPGLQAMVPGGEFLRALVAVSADAPPDHPMPEYFAAAADFEPGPILANLFDLLDAEGRVVDDSIFGRGVRNDIAVPFEGVWNPAAVDSSAPVGPDFPVDAANRFAIGPGSTYWHSDYFDDPDMRGQLLAWLTKR